MKRIILLITILTTALTACSQDKTIVRVEGGKVKGVETTLEGVYVYKGIPYAAAPVGELRWKAPQPVTPWKGVKLADTFGAPSLQEKHQPGGYTSEFFFEGDPEFSEDCLYLNVWTKAPGEKDRKLPVALWIHGGAYTAGWGWEPEMDGKVWASKDVVLVTFNYRLGVFGFLAHPFLSEENEHHVSGNYGLLDQIAALKWVHNNIAAFGGDPDNITIVGQSAGAGSVKNLVSSPMTGDLIKKAVIQSGGGVTDRPMLQATGLEKIAENNKRIFDWAGYDTIEKMRNASAEDIFNINRRYREETGKWNGIQTSPIVDGWVSPQSFDDAAREGKIKDIPYMIGFTLDDMGVLTEGIDLFCELRNKAGKAVYAYQFARPLPDDVAGSHDMKGAFHSSELWYTFKSLDRSDRPFTRADYELAEHMSNCWTNFFKSGNPGEGWRAYTVDHPDYMIFKLSEDESSDASAMGKPIIKEQPDFMAMMAAATKK